MSSFTRLMALSVSQTQKSQNEVENALRERQRKEEMRRKQQEEKEAKDREIERKMRLKHFEDAKREEERQKRLDADRKAREAALQRREEEQRDALRYGPKKAVKHPSSDGAHPKWPSSASRDASKRSSVLDDDDSVAGGLTREELRKKKELAEQRRLFPTAKRPAHVGSSYRKHGKKLPGGVLDVMTSSSTPEAIAGKSVKDRIAAMPNTLTRLNQVKRDTRTIDEILQDMAKAKEGKVLDGDDARGFSDWFTPPKKDVAKKSSQPTPSAATSGANTPASSNGGGGLSSHPSMSSTVPSPKKSVTPAPSKPSALKSVPRSSGPPPTNIKSVHSAPRVGSSDRRGSLSNGRIPKNSMSSGTFAERPHSSATHKSSSIQKKRPRSISRSESPPYKKRNVSPKLTEDISSTIWSLFGRDRQKYLSRDVMSDDEDMEADATALEREEKFSARVAKEEDIRALEEERRHEEEKRRKRKEKERMLARG